MNTNKKFKIDELENIDFEIEDSETAYFTNATFKGRSLTDEELDELTNDHWDFLEDKINDREANAVDHCYDCMMDSMCGG